MAGALVCDTVAGPRSALYTWAGLVASWDLSVWHGPVNSAWRKRAGNLKRILRCRGLRTFIEWLCWCVPRKETCRNPPLSLLFSLGVSESMCWQCVCRNAAFCRPLNLQALPPMQGPPPGTFCRWGVNIQSISVTCPGPYGAQSREGNSEHFSACRHVR